MSRMSTSMSRMSTTGKIKIGGIMQTSRLVEIVVTCTSDYACTAAGLMKVLGGKGINVQFIVQCVDIQGNDHVAFCVSEDQLPLTRDILERMWEEAGAGEVNQRPSVAQRENVALISIFGPDFRERPGIAGTMFTALDERGIHILAISTSISTLSCVISADRLGDAATALCETFELP